MADTARKISLHILNTLDEGHKTLDNILDDLISKDTRLTRKDRTLAHALVYGALRWRGRLDWIIDYFSKTRLDKIDPRVLNILRLGLFQILFLDRIPVSAAVNTSVEMVKSIAPNYVVRFANGLLRRAAREHEHVPFPDLENDPVSALAATKSLPGWLIKRWLDRFGPAETGQICDAINTIPPITVRCNTLKVPRKTLKNFLEKYGEKVGYTVYAPDGVSFWRPKKSIPELPIFKDGLFQVQDEAAQLVTLLLNPKPGETVLDACAGLGGKTGHIAQIMNNRGKIVAMDKNRKKLGRLESEMHRLGISIVTARPHDLNAPFNRDDREKFDRILLDAPCSGLGVLRRNPDAKWRIMEEDLRNHQKRQSEFLDNLAGLLKPGGVMVYAVCSTEPEENELVIKGFLNKHPEFAIEKNLEEMTRKARALITEDGYFRPYPHLHNMDGFFSVPMKRTK